MAGFLLPLLKGEIKLISAVMRGRKGIGRNEIIRQCFTWAALSDQLFNAIQGGKGNAAFKVLALVIMANGGITQWTTGARFSNGTADRTLEHDGLPGGS